MEQADHIVTNDPLAHLRGEANSIKEQALHAAELHFANETPWFHLHYFLGIPAALLAGVAGALGISKAIESSQTHTGRDLLIVGGISIVTAVLTSLTTFLNPLQTAAANHTSAKGFEALYIKTSFFYYVDLNDHTADQNDLRRKLTDLNERFIELRAASPAISERAYRTVDSNRLKGYYETVLDPRDKAHRVPKT